jgi:photosystem II stability/assembly factor-like uncharacterized protein
MRLFLSFLFLLTTSAHAQWNKIDVPTTASLRGLSTVGANVVWASGTQGMVIRTVDDGKSWSVRVVPGAEKLDFRGIHAFDDRTAIVISSGPAEKGQARIYRTDDGGKTWKQVFEEQRPGIFFDAVAFWDRKHGIVLSDPVEGRFALFTTQDGGSSWKQVSSAALPLALPNEGAFAASNSCLTVQGDKNVWFATGGGSVARVFRSRDRGRHWKVSDTPMHPGNASSGLFSLAFMDEKFGVAVGGDYAHPYSSKLPNVLVTSDGGRLWRTRGPTDPQGVYLSSVAVVSRGLNPAYRAIWAVGTIGVFSLRVSSNEKEWTRDDQQELNSIADSGQGAWAVGPNGIVMHKVLFEIN